MFQREFLGFLQWRNFMAFWIKWMWRCDWGLLLILLRLQTLESFQWTVGDAYVMWSWLLLSFGYCCHLVNVIIRLMCWNSTRLIFSQISLNNKYCIGKIFGYWLIVISRGMAQSEDIKRRSLIWNHCKYSGSRLMGSIWDRDKLIPLKNWKY